MTESGFTRNDWLRLLIVVGWLIVFVYWPRLVFAITLLGIGAALLVGARACKKPQFGFWVELGHASSCGVWVAVATHGYSVQASGWRVAVKRKWTI